MTASTSLFLPYLLLLIIAVYSFTVFIDLIYSVKTLTQLKIEPTFWHHHLCTVNFKNNWINNIYLLFLNNVKGKRYVAKERKTTTTISQNVNRYYTAVSIIALLLDSFKMNRAQNMLFFCQISVFTIFPRLIQEIKVILADILHIAKFPPSSGIFCLFLLCCFLRQ